MSTENPTLTINGASHPLRLDLAAIYRLQGLPEPPDLGAPDGRRSIRTMIDTVWAALAPDAGFSTPEALAAALGDGLGGIDTITRAYAAINAAATPTAEKKSDTTPSLSRASNSG